MKRIVVALVVLLGAAPSALGATPNYHEVRTLERAITRMVDRHFHASPDPGTRCYVSKVAGASEFCVTKSWKRPTASRSGILITATTWVAVSRNGRSWRVVPPSKVG